MNRMWEPIAVTILTLCFAASVGILAANMIHQSFAKVETSLNQR